MVGRDVLDAFPVPIYSWLEGNRRILVRPTSYQANTSNFKSTYAKLRKEAEINGLLLLKLSTIMANTKKQHSNIPRTFADLDLEPASLKELNATLK